MADREQWLSDYQRRWPKGLIRYSTHGVGSGLPENARRFLAETGLPIGREPAWTFSGELQRKDYPQGPFFQFGLRGVSPLLLRPDGSVWLLRAEGAEPSYCNGTIEQFAQCLTFASKGDKSLMLDDLSIPDVVLSQYSARCKLQDL